MTTTPKHLTAEEARTLTRGELLDRIETEQAYWHAKNWDRMTETRRNAEREFRRIMHAALDPGAMLADTADYVRGIPSAGGYMDQRPDIPDAPAVHPVAEGVSA